MSFSNSINSRKMLQKTLQNNIDLFCLIEVNKHNIHGWEIMTRIHKTFGILVGPSTVYPCLSLLQKRGFVTSFWDMSTTHKPRKMYAITKLGQVHVRELSMTFGVIVGTFGGLEHAKEQITS